MPKRTPPGSKSRVLEKRVVGRHKELLSDPKVKSWWEERSLRSRLSADQLLRVLGLTLERLKLTPASALTLAQKDPDRLRDLLIHEATRLKAEGRLDTYIAKLFEGLKAYLAFHRVTFDGFPSLSPIKGASLTDERVPTPEELARVLENLTLRGRVVALFMAHSGLRPGVLGSYQGEGGLTLGDLPDLRIGTHPSFTEVPFVVRVPARLSKTRQAYTTFGSSQIADRLLSYLKERLESGEKLGPESPVVASLPTKGAAATSQKDARFSRGFLTTKAVIEEIRDALQATVPDGVRWRPYVLRAYCSTRLLSAEGAGKITRDLREAILGHDTGISGRYTVGKTWGPDLLKEARAAYKRSEPYLSTSGAPTTSTEEIQREAAVLLLTGLRGRTEQEARKMVEGKSGSELAGLLKALSGPAEPERRPQKAVPVAEVPGLLEAGWEMVGDLNGEMKVLRAPAAPPSGPELAPSPP